MGTKVNTKSLAYLGDAVFELLVREMLLSKGDRPVDVLNVHARRYVSAAAQAAMYKKINPSLTVDEQSAMKRGRNLHSYSKAKNANTSDYRHSTGLETLFGYLYTNNQHERMAEVFDMCLKGIEDDCKS